MRIQVILPSAPATVVQNQSCSDDKVVQRATPLRAPLQQYQSPAWLGHPMYCLIADNTQYGQPKPSLSECGELNPKLGWNKLVHVSAEAAKPCKRQPQQWSLCNAQTFTDPCGLSAQNQETAPRVFMANLFRGTSGSRGVRQIGVFKENVY